MSNGKEDWRRARRGRKRGGFDDDDSMYEGGGGWSPPPSPSAARPLGGTRPPRPPRAGPVAGFGPEVGVVVRRFDPERGFGFVQVEGGSDGDAFLHISVLQRAGADSVALGQRLRVRVGPGQKGPQVTEVLEVGEVDPAALAAQPPRARPGGGRAMPSLEGAEEVRGVVRWYDAAKGFGFVAREDGGKDVFVHASALARSGMTPLTEGQTVLLRVVPGKKGPEAALVEPAA